MAALGNSSASSASFNDQHFEKKLLSLKDSQESIQGLSGWCIQHKAHYKHFIPCWLKVMKRAKIEMRLTLFYLANDVIQHSKKKNILNIVTAWESSIKEAVPYVRDPKLRKQILRIFSIWEERDVYSKDVIEQFMTALQPRQKNDAAEKAAIADFDPAVLPERLRLSKTFEEETDLKQRRLSESSIKITDVETLRSRLKDRKKTAEFFAEFEDSIVRMEEYVQALQTETEERAKLITVLEQSNIFYETQRGEFKVLCNAYKNFASRVKAVKRKLEEVTPGLSETGLHQELKQDAPSPTSANGSDLELPDAFEKPPPLSDRSAKQEPVAQDLDSRLNIFLSGGSANALFGIGPSNPPASLLSPVPSIDSGFGFYPPAPFANPLGAFLSQPPPPPPPPPPLLPPPVFSELPLPPLPPPPPAPTSAEEGNAWPQPPMPNWSSEDDKQAHLFSEQDIDLRNRGRPVVHSNLISLTQGTDSPGRDTDWRKNSSSAGGGTGSSGKDLEMPPWLKEVLQSQESIPAAAVAERNMAPSDEERINRLLDSVSSKLNETETPPPPPQPEAASHHTPVRLMENPVPRPSEWNNSWPREGNRPFLRGESPRPRGSPGTPHHQGKYRPRPGFFKGTPPWGQSRPHGPRW